MAPLWGPVRSLLALAPLLILAPLLALRVHYALPAPILSQHDAAGRAQFSEAAALAHVRHLTKVIGYRTIGTPEHAASDVWMRAQVEALERECTRLAIFQSRTLECEVWHQVGSGSHSWDIMGHRMDKLYAGIPNVILRISNGTAAGKAHAILINAHFDSQLPGPGATDDALGVGVMLEAARVLINDPAWTPEQAVVFLFNGAEESFCDAAHLFTTQHSIASTVRAVINLEAMGTTGAEMLFQATSDEMISTYANVPYPMGTVVASDVFKTGILLSDTDFRMFVKYLNVSGVDLAVVGNSYFYHTRADTIENIEPGVAQHMGDNILSMLRELTGPRSALPSLAAQGPTAPSRVYASYLGSFINLSPLVAGLIYTILLATSLYLLCQVSAPAPFLRTVARATIKDGPELGAFIGGNALAALMRALGRPMSFFAVEYSALLLYGPAALGGALGSLLVWSPQRSEHEMWAAGAARAFMGALVLQAAGFGSGVLFAVSAAPMVLVLAAARATGHAGRLPVWAYALGGLGGLVTCTLFTAIVLDIFVPLTGRMGASMPADHVVASLVAILGTYTLPLLAPFAGRFGRLAIIRGVVLCTLASAISVAVFCARSPFDAQHQRRLLVLHMHNTTTGEENLQLAAIEGAPGMDKVVAGLSSSLGAPGAVAETVQMGDYTSDWDVIYPISAFLAAHRIALPTALSSEAVVHDGKIVVQVTGDITDKSAGTRTLTLQVDHPGVIWPVLSFDAHILSWSLSAPPPVQHERHHLKLTTGLGFESHTLSLVLPATHSPLVISHVGMRERALWPARSSTLANGEAKGATARALRLLSGVEAWIEDNMGGIVEPFAIACVGGVTIVG